MGGIAFALLAAFLFASYLSLFRRVVARTGEYSTSMLLMLPVGILLYLALMMAFGGFSPLASLNLRIALIFAAAGVVNMILGRGLNFHAIRLLGNNRAVPLVNTGPIYAGLLGIFFLNEPFSPALVVGIAFVVAGAGLVGQTGGGNPGSLAVGASFWEGVLAALGAGLSFALGAVVARYILLDFPHPLQGNLISYGAALAVVGWMPLLREHRARVVRLPRDTLALILVGGLLVSAAGFSQYMALNQAAASVVGALQATYGLFILLLSWLLNRRLEVFSTTVVLGIVATVVGTVLVAL